MLKTTDRNGILKVWLSAAFFLPPIPSVLSPCKICLYAHAVVPNMLKSVCYLGPDEKKKVDLGLKRWVGGRERELLIMAILKEHE